MRKLILLVAIALFAISCNNAKTDEKTASSAPDSTANKTVPQSEFADQRYVDIGKKSLEQMSSGDIDGWVAGFADNAVYQWSSGDSLAGKAAIAEYWKNRRTKVIDSIAFSTDIWLPIKVNRPQRGPDVVGIWLLGWYRIDVKYKNGQKVGMFVHADFHFNSDDKIDRAIQYIDRAPINAALAKK